MKGEAYLEFHPDRFVYFSYHSGRADGSKSEINTRQGRVGRGIEKGGGGEGGYSLLVNWEEVYAGLCPENTYFGQINHHLLVSAFLSPFPSPLLPHYLCIRYDPRSSLAVDGGEVIDDPVVLCATGEEVMLGGHEDEVDGALRVRVPQVPS